MNQMNLFIDILYNAGRLTADLFVRAGIHTQTHFILPKNFAIDLAFISIIFNTRLKKTDIVTPALKSSSTFPR